MTAENDGDEGGDRPTKPSPEEVVRAEETLDTLMEALATVTGKMHGLEGAEIHAHVKDVQTQVRSLVEMTRLRERDAEAHNLAAARVEKLIDTVTKNGTPTAKALAKQRGQVSQAFRGIDLAKMADGLRVFAEWLRKPTDSGQVEVEQLIAQLQATMGPAAAWDAQRQEAEQKKEIDEMVKASLDEIFRPKLKKD